MRKIVVGVMWVLMSALTFAAPEVTDVVAKQRYPWNGKIDISYNLSGNVAEGLPAWMTQPVLVVSAIDRTTGSNYVAAVSALTGDTGIEEGAHHVVWDLNAQNLQVKSNDMVFTVAYESKPRLYCVVNLSAGVNATSYPVVYLNNIPDGGWSDEYKTTKLVLRYIEPGSFMMNGSYYVTLTQGYYCGIFEVTQKQYELVTGNKPSNWRGDVLPVEKVSWDMIRGNSSTHNWPTVKTVDSNSFVGRLQARTGLNFDLPTEAQWEYACRAGTTTTYYWGDSIDGAYAWNCENSSSKTHEVGMTAPNAWGLYDMSGNVWERCLDWYGDLSGGLDPEGSLSGSNRVKRGGSWNYSGDYCTTSYRGNGSPLNGIYDNGFRLVRTLLSTNNEQKNDAAVGAERVDRVLHFGSSESVNVDSCNEPIVSSIDVQYNSAWIGGDSLAEVVISVNGTEIKRTTGEGEFTYSPTTPGKHTLTYTTYIDDVAQSEVYSATVFADWKYTVENGKATITETTFVSGDVLIPSEIDGYEVTAVADSVFKNCGELVSVTVPSDISMSVIDGVAVIRSNYPCVMGGDEKWTNDEDGSLRSGKIGDDEESWLEMAVEGAGLLSFKWKASTEAYRSWVMDYAYLSVDGMPLGTLNDSTLDGIAIGGEKDWVEVVLPIEEKGPHAIRWTYKKDDVDEGNIGEDCVWVDAISYKVAIEASFEANGAVGNEPEAIRDYQDGKIVLPSYGGLKKEKHYFVGWSDGVDTYSAGIEYVLPKTNMTFKAVWAAKTLSAPVIVSDDVENGGEIDTDSAMITITADEGALIYYTLDGSEPTIDGGKLYEGAFAAVDMDVKVRAIAVKDDYFDSPISRFDFTRLPYSLGECINQEEAIVSSNGDAQWTRVLGDGAHDDIAALKSGVIDHSGISSVEMKVKGGGEISFWWKVSSESYRTFKLDYVSFEIDGVEKNWRAGEVDWTNEVWVVEGVGDHVLKWSYRKDVENTTGEDCAWLDEVVWKPDPIPELSSTATLAEVASILEGFADARLTENIKTAAEYAAFREWALNLEGATPEEVKASPNAWLSYALNTDKLIEGEVTESRLKVTSFKLSVENNLFSIKLKLDGVAVGDAATVENLLKIFAIEGAKDVGESSFSVDNVVLDIVQSNEGEVEFIVSPLVRNASFFYRPRMRDTTNGVGMNTKRDKVQLWKGGPYWATTNIGAEKPEDYGYYFWWGDTVGYKWENEKWVASDGSNSNFSFTTGNAPTRNKSDATLQSEGWITADGVLAPEHDAAQAHWGGDWRMPTKQEFNDLHNNCDWTWTTMNGVNGYVVRGRGEYASNSIFLPCVGNGTGTSLNNAGSYGYYWSSVPYSATAKSWYLYFGSGNHGTYDNGRYYGRSVRPLQGFSK